MDDFDRRLPALPREWHQRLHRHGAEPYREGARMGRPRGRRAIRPTRRFYRMFDSYEAAGGIRGHAARGLPQPGAGQLHPLSRDGEMGLDDVQRVSMGPELGESGSLPRHPRHDPLARQSRGRGIPARRGGLHVEAHGHDLPEPARGSRHPAGAGTGHPHRRARRDPQGRGHRRAARPRPLPRTRAPRGP